MPVKRDLKFLCLRLFYHLRGLKAMAWVTVAGMNVLVPLLNYRSYLKAGADELALLPQEFHQLMAAVAPVLCVWWVLFVLREYVESDGVEVLYVCPARQKIGDALVLFLLFLANMSVIYAVYIHLFPEMRRSFCMLICVCIFVFGLTFLLMFLTKSVTITLMVILLYVIVSILFIDAKHIFPFFSANSIATVKLLKEFYLPLACGGVLLTAGGVVLNQKKLV